MCLKVILAAIAVMLCVSFLLSPWFKALRVRMEHLWGAPEGMEPHEASASSRLGAIVAFLVALAVVALGLWFALSYVDAESRWFLSVQATRLSLAGLISGLARFAVSCFCAIFAYQTLENSRLGARLGDPGNLMAALLVAAAIAFHTGAQ